MALNLVKLCVGADNVDDLADWQKERLAEQKRAGVAKPILYHRTYQTPKRQSELMDGGSLYWVIKGVILVRQRITGFSEGRKDDGSPCCLIHLDRRIVPVRPTPRRAFQGWRYLEPDESPVDLACGGRRDGIAEMPAAMRKELAALGLI